MRVPLGVDLHERGQDLQARAVFQIFRGAVILFPTPGNLSPVPTICPVDKAKENEFPWLRASPAHSARENTQHKIEQDHAPPLARRNDSSYAYNV